MRLRFLLPLLFFSGAAYSAPRVVAVNIGGVVHPVTVEILGHAMEQARQEKAAALLVRINTPGGLLEATREAVEKILNSPIPVITYVTPSGGRAASAGFFLLEAGDVAVMARGTNTGSASPVILGQQMDPVMRKKVDNDASAWVRSIAERRNRNAKLAEQAVLEAKSFTEKEALDQKLIDLVSGSEDELFTALDGREVARFDGRKERLVTAGAVIANYEPRLRERVMAALSDPNLAFLLLLLGALGIYIEFSSPGLIVPGTAGGILVLLGLSALSVMPIHWGGVALLLLGIVLFVLEAKIASHGILGAGGAVAMVLGAVLLVDAPPELRIRWSTAIGVTLPFALITVLLLTLVVRARKNKVETGVAGLVGAMGTARSALVPEGTVLVHGEFWNAVSPAPLEEGTPVKVVAVEGLKLKVERAS